MFKYVNRMYPDLDLIGKNVVTMRQAGNLIEVAIDRLRVGMGFRSICTIRDVCAVSHRQANSCFYGLFFFRATRYPVIADGGLSNSRHLVKALVLGTLPVMMGSFLAGSNEVLGTYQY